MTEHPHVVVVMKAAIADLEDLREKAWALARTYAFNQSNHWDEERGEEIAFRFENPIVASIFKLYCINHGIQSRAQGPADSSREKNYAPMVTAPAVGQQVPCASATLGPPGLDRHPLG